MEINTVLYMPDGNRRFARENKKTFDEAYYLGGKTLRLFSEFFVSNSISNKFIFHAMSNYTYQRTDSSLKSIYKALKRTFEDLIDERFFENKDISFKWIDHSGKLPEEVKNPASQLSELTKNCENGEVIALLGYSLEEDINQALAQNPKDYDSFRKKLIFQDIDLVVRPYEMRVSKGPIYAMAQAQMLVLNKLNPEVTNEDLEKVLEEYSRLKHLRNKR